MRHVCIITTHPFWLEPLGCGTSLRSRYELLKCIATKVSVLFITHTDQSCPLPGGTLRMADTGVQASHLAAIQQFVKDREVSLVYFSYDQFARLARVLPCKTAVEIHDVMHLRQQQFEAFGYSFPVRVDAAQEISSLKCYDHVFAINASEAEYLQRQGVAQAAYLPPAIPFRRIENGSGIWRFGLIASQAVPNRDGFEQIKPWLATTGPLVLAGPLAVADVAALSGHPSLTNLGVVDSPADFYRCIDVALSPVRFGAGLKIKVLEALSCGKSVLATSHSIEGFPAGIERFVQIEDDLSAWNDRQLEAARDIDTRELAGWYQEHFSPERVRALLTAHLS